MNLSARDLVATMDVLKDIYAETDPEAFPIIALHAIAKLVRSKLAAVTEVDPVLGRSTGWFYPPEVWKPADIIERFQTHILDHPVVEYVGRTRDGRAKAISDFLTPAQFHSRGLYRELFQPMGIEDQLSIAMVGGSGLMIGLSFNRARRGFSERDRQILNLLRPHVLQAYINCREIHQLRNTSDARRGTVIDQLPIGLLCVEKRGRIIWSTEMARRLLSTHYHDAVESIHGLPNVVRLWLKKNMSPVSSIRIPKQLLARRRGVEMRIRFCPLKDGQAILLFQENLIAAPRLSLEQYAFTKREQQVLSHIVKGNTAAEAAEEFSISPRTVQKHLERIFKKLGVTSLAAACVKVLGSSG
jgi:DNA-binding NarL/FixJ family response regulator